MVKVTFCFTHKNTSTECIDANTDLVSTNIGVDIECQGIHDEPVGPEHLYARILMGKTQDVIALISEDFNRLITENGARHVKTDVLPNTSKTH